MTFDVEIKIIKIYSYFNHIQQFSSPNCFSRLIFYKFLGDNIWHNSKKKKKKKKIPETRKYWVNVQQGNSLISWGEGFSLALVGNPSRNVFLIKTLVQRHPNPIQNEHFWGCSRMGGGQKDPLPKICHTYPTMMKLGIYLKKIEKIYKSRDTPTDFC